MKSFTILATFPTLPASVAQQAVTMQASTLPVAVNRALAAVMRRPGVKGRRIETVTVRVTCNGEVEKEGAPRE